MNRNLMHSFLNSLLIVLTLSACIQPEEHPLPTIEKLPTPELTPLPLSAPGPYHVGKIQVDNVDTNRQGRAVNITIWYPASLSPDAASSIPLLDAEPNPSAAPYPLILSSTKLAKILAPTVVSYGFVWASVDDIDYYMKMNEEMVDQPLDILFTLNQVASNPPEKLKGIINSDQTGVTGYSFDGYNTLALSGARIDPNYYLAQCPTPDAISEAILSSMSAFGCDPANDWESYSSHAGKAITTSEDGLWQPITDARIRAVIPMAGEGWWLFGEKGLAEVDRPVMMIAATGDELYSENALIFDHLGTNEKVFISFIGRSHMMIFDRASIARLSHFVTAFFGYHLQGHTEYAEYFSKEFISKYDDLAWGVVESD